DAAAFTPRPGIDAFAVFYIIAQALERASELLRVTVPSIGDARASLVRGKQKPRKTKHEAIADRDRELSDALNGEPGCTAETVAKSQETLNRCRANTAV